MRTGKVKAGPIPGEATIMARFAEKFAVCDVLIPLPGAVAPEVYAKLPRQQLHRRSRLGEAPSS